MSDSTRGEPARDSDLPEPVGAAKPERQPESKPASSKEPAPKPAPEPVKDQSTGTEATQKASEPLDPSVAKRQRKLAKVSRAAKKDAQHHQRRRKVGAALLSCLAVGVTGGLVAAGSLLLPEPDRQTLPAAVTSLPAGDAQSVCLPAPQLLKGVDGVDPQFEPGAKDISTSLRTALVSDLAKRMPGASLSALDGSDAKDITKRIDEQEAAEAKGADTEGLTGRVARVDTDSKRSSAALFGVQPLGQLPSIGSGLRSFFAKDGDLAGLAIASCQVPSANWRFTGLQTQTGTTSVLHLANPTRTSAQLNLQLRGREGLIDAPTLQNIVLAPGATRAIVLGAYAPDEESVAVSVDSTGGKITAMVQQASLRGLTPSGVDWVQANAVAAAKQVIPGVWIPQPGDLEKLTGSGGQNNLVPQLHVAATGAAGAGFTVKLLDAKGEVKAELGDNLAVASNATSIVDLSSVAPGTYSVVVESNDPVTASVRMVRGSDPKKSSDQAWAASSQALNGTQAMPVAAEGNGEFTLTAPFAASEVRATVVGKDGKLHKSQSLKIAQGTSVNFKPRDTDEQASAVVFEGDSNAYIAQLVWGADRSLGWAAMPQATTGRDGIVVNVAG
ncbi:hypothetical protein GCM10027417_18510 [Glutamicibacter endophyticus]